MQLTGSLSEFSWSDLLRFLDQSQQTGRLTLQIPERASSPYNCRSKSINLWFSQGYILATASKLNSRGLLGLIHQQGWLPYKTGDRLAHTLPAETALGTYLKQQGAITYQQLRSLFQYQVLNTVQGVAELTTADFVFETVDALPYMEMTGLKLAIYEVQSFLVPRAA